MVNFSYNFLNFVGNVKNCVYLLPILVSGDNNDYDNKILDLKKTKNNMLISPHAVKELLDVQKTRRT